jgi:hypothetical protein
MSHHNLSGGSMRHLIGGDGVILRPDALGGFADSAEPQSSATRLSRRISPTGEAGDSVFRRVYFTVRYDSPISFTVHLVVDDKRRPGYTFTASGSGRDTWMIPMVEKGSSVQLEITSDVPGANWSVENIEVKYQPGHDSWRRA